ncbi:MAG: potassium channel protein [Deltaproteobacteria bacterium]|nr:potassium channel protein [Deltaproteobacteria bacterium]
MNLTTATRSPGKRLLLPVVMILAILILGSIGYYFLADGRYSPGECAYMTAITVSTVGFEEVIDVRGDPLLRAYTVMLIFMGTGSILYLLSNVTAFLVEGELNQYIRRLRMENEIRKLRDHYVICGVGRNGEHAARQMLIGGFPFVVVDSSQETIQAFIDSSQSQVLNVTGDAKDEQTLIRAGIDHAKGLVAALPEDADNIFLILSARELNPNLRIVSKINELGARKKFMQVGADSVVSPTSIGGVRLFGEMVRPGVASFLDDIIPETSEDLTMDEVFIPDGSPLDGKKLAESGIRERTNLLVVGVRGHDNNRFDYNPGPGFELDKGMTLIVLGPRDAVTKLRRMSGGAA